MSFSVRLSRRSRAGRARLHWRAILIRIRSKTKDRKCWGDLLELRELCVLFHRDMRSRSRCTLKVSPQDRCALDNGDLLELDLFSTATKENSSSTGCAYVLDPLDVISEHRYQISLSVDDRDDHGQRDRPARLSSDHF